jgi:hypothetical protein
LSPLYHARTDTDRDGTDSDSLLKSLSGMLVVLRWLLRLRHAAVESEKEVGIAKSESLVAQTAKVSYEKTLRYGKL